MLKATSKPVVPMSPAFLRREKANVAASLLCVLIARLGADWIYETAIDELRASGTDSRWTPNDTDPMFVERI